MSKTPTTKADQLRAMREAKAKKPGPARLQPHEPVEIPAGTKLGTPAIEQTGPNTFVVKDKAGQKKQLIVRIPIELHRELKIRAAETETTIEALVEMYVRQCLETRE
jgi:hypothetical protein